MTPERERIIRRTYEHMVSAAPVFKGNHIWWPIIYDLPPPDFRDDGGPETTDSSVLFTWRLERGHLDGQPGWLRFVECEGLRFDPLFKPDSLA